MSGLDTDLIRHALETARTHDLRQIRIVQNDDEFEAIVGASVPELYEEDPSFELENDADPPTEIMIKAPVVGYLRELDNPPALGDSIEQGQTIAIIAALGIKNDVSCPASGTLLEWLVPAGQAVEFGQQIARLKVKS